MRYTAACVVFAAGMVACGGSPAAPKPTQVAKVGDLSAAMVAGSSDSIRVKVSDASGSPVGGVAVTFAVTAGGGSVAPASVQTADNGVASAKFTTGTSVGANTVTASGTGLSGSPIAFSVTTVAGAAASVTTSTNLASNTVAGAGDSIRVLVKDANGNLVSGATVTFAVTAGGGSLTATTGTTIASGVAATRWITGTTVGVNTVTATVSGVSPLSLSTTTIAGAATQLSLGGRTVIVDPASGATLVPAFKDANGNASTGGTVTYLSRSPSIATVSTAGVIASVAAGSSFIVASTAGFSDSVLAVSAVSGGLVLGITDLPRFDLKTDTIFTITIAMDMRSSGEKLGSADITITWDPTELTYQSDSDPSSPMTVSANSGSASSGSYQLGVASGAGSTGSVLLRRLTFKAASSAARTGSLGFTVAAVTGAATYTDLKAKTTAASYPLKTR